MLFSNGSGKGCCVRCAARVFSEEISKSAVIHRGYSYLREGREGLTEQTLVNQILRSLGHWRRDRGSRCRERQAQLILFIFNGKGVL
jgi:hypothetical protein